MSVTTTCVILRFIIFSSTSVTFHAPNSEHQLYHYPPEVATLQLKLPVPFLASNQIRGHFCSLFSDHTLSHQRFWHIFLSPLVASFPVVLVDFIFLILFFLLFRHYTHQLRIRIVENKPTKLDMVHWAVVVEDDIPIFLKWIKSQTIIMIV